MPCKLRRKLGVYHPLTNPMSDQADYIEVSLLLEAHRWAEQFAAEQATVAKGKQVYLNTLSVYAVHTYLKWMSIWTDLAQSDCWHPELRARFDIADLVIPKVGKLECRSLLPKQTEFVLPPEVIRDRVGYVVVQFTTTLDRVTLLGFLPVFNALASLPISIIRLTSLEHLLDLISLSEKL